MCKLVTDLILNSRAAAPESAALRDGAAEWSYATLADQVECAANRYLELGLARGERVAVYLEKRLETVAALFGAAAAGGVFVPVNPLLKQAQVLHILNDCSARLLVTSPERLALLAGCIGKCPSLRAVIVVGQPPAAADAMVPITPWETCSGSVAGVPHRVIDADMAAILYTSGSTGRPKGVVLSHRNLVAGAASVASYLENGPRDRVLAVLPLSFDYGLSQLTTMFHAGGCAVLMNYLLPGDVIRAVARERITGLAAVPPLWIQLAQLNWPDSVGDHLRYFTNSGGHLPGPTLAALRARLPASRPYLMYGLTEAFRSTYLPPEEVDHRPDSIGKAIPNAEILVVRPDGSSCDPGEPGELVHRGIHVSLGYWNDPVGSAERFRPAPGQDAGLPLPELAVWSGDTVRRDAEGYLYFIGRRDEMIKTSGYRVSPGEVEEVAYATGLAQEVAAIGVPHPVLGQAVLLVAVPHDTSDAAAEALLEACRRELPAYMVPARIVLRRTCLPRNPNGKIDRVGLASELAGLFEST